MGLLVVYTYVLIVFDLKFGLSLFEFACNDNVRDDLTF